jgi:hypothetical protein
MLETTFLSYNYPIMLTWQSQPALKSISFFKKKKKNPIIDWDCHVSIER